MLQLKMKSENTFNKYWKFCVLIPKGEHMDQLKYFIFHLLFSIAWKVIQYKPLNK